MATGQISVKEHQSFPVKRLSAYEHNAKLHTDEQVQHIANSIADTAFDQPIVCDEAGVIIAGHGRLLAALKIGRKSVPVWQVSGLTDSEKRALRLADNKLNLDTGFDVKVLRGEIEKLRAGSFDLARYSLDFDLQSLMAGEREVDVDTTREKGEAYDAADSKQIVLYFTADEHDIFSANFSALAAAWHLETFAAVLLEMLRRQGVKI